MQTQAKRGRLARTIYFLAKAIPIGFVVVAIISVVSGRDLSVLMTKHGLFDFILLCTLVGGILVWFFGKLGPGSQQYENTKKEFGEAVGEIKELRAQAKKQSQVKRSEPVDIASSNDKKTGMLTKLTQAAGGMAAYNAAARPIVVALDGGTVHAATPKGLNQWEIYYSVPGDSRVHKQRYGRGTVGFSHGQYRFKIDWPSIF